jgi:radical SAM superfamily enzyme YgiQ (UPF0313 family)
MKITLISPVLFDLGICTIAPQLKTRHQVKILFVPNLLDSYLSDLSDKGVSRITEFLKDSELIGINSFSENYQHTAILVSYIKKTLPKIPLVWGGIHATLKPSDCIKYADIVCIGEGEEAMVELAGRMERGQELYGIDNLLFPSRPEEKAQIRPPVPLDSLLPFDYDFDRQYLLEGNSIRKIKEEDFKGIFATYTNRGCPFNCSYCCNEFIAYNLYAGHRYFRQRNVASVISDLKLIKNRFPSCQLIWFNDADFLAGKSQDIIENFSRDYKAEVGIPFSFMANPLHVTDEKIRLLKDAGLAKINIGTVNANIPIQKDVYNRNAPVELYKRCADIINKYDILVEYDFILCNPYENEEQIINTINFLRTLPKPFKTLIYGLTYFPRTQLYNRALKDNIIKENQPVQSYTKAGYRAWKFQNKSLYINAIASIIRGRARRGFLGLVYYGALPEPLLNLLIKKPVRKFLGNSFFVSSIYPIIGDFIKLAHTSALKILKYKFSPEQSLKSFFYKDSPGRTRLGDSASFPDRLAIKK